MAREKQIEAIELNLIHLFRQLKNESYNVIGDVMSRNQFLALDILYKESPQMASSISKQFQVSASHITVLMDELVEKGFVERTRSTKDRRIVEIAITQEGKQALLEVQKRKKAYFKTKMNFFNDEELLQFNRLLEKLGK